MDVSWDGRLIISHLYFMPFYCRRCVILTDLEIIIYKVEWRERERKALCVFMAMDDRRIEHLCLLNKAPLSLAIR